MTERAARRKPVVLHKSYLPIPTAKKFMLEVEVNSGRLQKVAFCPRRKESRAPDETSLQVLAALERYFDSPRDGTAFDALPPPVPATSSFQERVRQRLRAIAPGQTRPYGEIAKQLGDQHAAQAVGGACKKNPLVIIVPCHRVIAANGNLGGYTIDGFSLEDGQKLKQHLLEQEGWRPSA